MKDATFLTELDGYLLDEIIEEEKTALILIKHMNKCLQDELADDRPSEANIRTYKASIRIFVKSLGWV